MPHLCSEWELGLDSWGAQGSVSLKPLKSEGLFYVPGDACATWWSINGGERQEPLSHEFFLLQKTSCQQNFFFFLMSLKVGTFAGINKIHAGESPVSDSELNCNMWFLLFSWVRETLKLPLRSSIWLLRNPSEVYEPDPKLIAVGKIPDLSPLPVGLYKSYWSIYITFSRGKKNHLSHTAKTWRLNF